MAKKEVLDIALRASIKRREREHALFSFLSFLSSFRKTSRHVILSPEGAKDLLF